ncbi:DHA2 family efflux MFS transporter permease subunit [Streptomyces sp. 3MP-14]|uniref:DHA2 family efflux MFS transporter permease subunit n=1 Tax=Streptomyces mimosae TaxID=2586635 RepID=A0A5N6A297_9ACTN|nr:MULTISPECIES: DHA2 family efflux MFS transporter permease subunit [Streptomyces]KAB8161790.1 DHA2 family efflux MFS transporter permease subunit [Streptomyces mimosae]KAB8174942.1 DHA2 family efflux MFS transporter permease subunit [Streptomyces sp. 3MP-14]
MSVLPARSSTRSPVAIALVTALASFTIVMDTTIVNVALHALAREFDAPLTTIQWVTSAYVLALASVIPAAPWAMGRFGARRVYLGAIALFVLGSAASGLAWNAESLIAFRALQGLGGGLITPVGMSLVLRAAAAGGRQGMLMSVSGLSLLVAPALGPVFGGWLVDEVSWRWMFLVNVPVGALAVVLAARVIPADEPSPGRRLDVPGLLLLSPGFAALIFGLTRANESADGFAAPDSWLPLLLGVALVLGFLRRAFTTGAPLLDLRLLRHRPLALGLLSLVPFVMGYFGSMLLTPMYFQLVRGDGVMESGLMTIQLGLAAGVTMQLAGRLVDRVAARWIVLPGMLLAATGMGWFAAVAEPGAAEWQLRTSLAVLGVGVGATMMPSITAATRSVAPADVPAASTLVNIGSQLATAVGSAVMAVLLAGRLGGTGGDPAATAEAFRGTYVWAVALILLAAVPAAFLPGRAPARPDAAPVGARSEEARQPASHIR